MKYATTIEQQIQKLMDRGLVITNAEKAKEVLLDIGYYRFGSYLFPFELTYPSKKTGLINSRHIPALRTRWIYIILIRT